LKADLADIPSLPIEENSISVITLLAVIEHLHLEESISLIEYLYRLLTPEGKLILTTPAHWTGPILWILALLNLLSTEEISEHKQLYSPKKITLILSEAGFKRSSILTGFFELGLNTWATACKKRKHSI
jgi:predicted SAM-dependent methyltransferase